MGLRRQTCAAHIQQKDDGLRGAHNIDSSIQAARHPTDISVSPCLLQYDKWREAHIQTRTDNSQGIDLEGNRNCHRLVGNTQCERAWGLPDHRDRNFLLQSKSEIEATGFIALLDQGMNSFGLSIHHEGHTQPRLFAIALCDEANLGNCREFVPACRCIRSAAAFRGRNRRTGSDPGNCGHGWCRR